MCSRRNYLSLLAITGSMTITGCVGSSNESSQPESPKSQSVGESIFHAGLKMTIPDYKIIDEFTEVTNDGSERDVQTPSPGAAFLFVNIVLKNVGKTEREVPSDDNINIIYKKEGISSDPFINMKVDNKIYSRYQKDYTSGLFPGKTLQGWVVFQVPREFTESDAVVTIERGGIRGGDVDNRIFRWQLEGTN